MPVPVKIGSAFQIGPTAGRQNSNVWLRNIEAGDDGTAVAVSYNATGIYVQVINGVDETTPTAINRGTSVTRPSVDQLADGRYVVTWSDPVARTGSSLVRTVRHWARNSPFPGQAR